MKILPVNFYKASAPKKNLSFSGRVQNSFNEMQNIDKIDLHLKGVEEPIAKENAKVPSFPTLNQLEQKYTSLNSDPHDYFNDLRKFTDYQHRLFLESNKMIFEDGVPIPSGFDGTKTLNTTDLNKYDETIEAEKTAVSNIKKAYKLWNVMKKSEDDFVERDMLVDKISELDKISAKLKDIEKTKYLLDENTERMKKDLISVKKRENHERENFGPSYYSTYPPSPTYIYRTFLESRIRSNPIESANLQKEYDKYLGMKNNMPTRESLKSQLDEVLARLEQNFEEVKELYKNFE